jgi:CRISPR-associated protein Cmr4
MNELQTAPIYQQRRFVFLTLDPIHVGTGGFRLGRVDMPVAREPGTNLPKIPGTTLAGAARSYAAMQYGKLEAAGQHKKLKEEGKMGCPIVYTFGTTRGSGGQAGRVSIFDARLLLFPVRSMAGPVWASTAELLEEAGFSVSQHPPGDERPSATFAWDRSINLSWLLFEKPMLARISDGNLTAQASFATVKDRIVVLTPRMFEQVVNSNLEVRTSVSIDPETGAAKDKALFTYEAIPRGAWLWCDVIEDDYNPSNSVFPISDKHNGGGPMGVTWSRPLDVVSSGLRLMEYMGVGGMGTRGFGRLRVVHAWTQGGAA